MGVCVVENLSRVFLFEWSLLNLWVIKVYIVWVEGKEVTHKNNPGKMFCDCLAGRPYPRDTHENDSLARLFSFQSCAPYVLFCGLASHELLTKSIDSSFKLETSPILILNPIQ